MYVFLSQCWFGTFGSKINIPEIIFQYFFLHLEGLLGMMKGERGPCLGSDIYLSLGRGAVQCQCYQASHPIKGR